MTTARHPTALLIARPSPLQIGLHALLISMPQIQIVHKADDLAAATDMMIAPPPVLVVVDGDVSKEIGLTVRRLRFTWPQARCVLLANDAQQEKTASAAGADAVLLKGFPAPKLIALLVRLLGQPQSEGGNFAARGTKRAEQSETTDPGQSCPTAQDSQVIC